MARRSAASFEVIALGEIAPVIEPPKSLSQSEAELFRSIVRQASRDHFTKNDREMLASYCQACSLVDLAYTSALASPKMLQDWERAVKTMINLSRQLRLAPRNRVDPRSLTRQLTGRSYASYPDQERIEQAKEGTMPSRDWKARG